MGYFENNKIKPENKEEFEKRKTLLMPYRLNRAAIDKYCPEAKIMHCMPCHIGYEIAQDAAEHASSIMLDQAENRMHAQKGILVWLYNKKHLIK